MAEATVEKVSAAHSPRRGLGQKYLASGTAVSMLLWKEAPGDIRPPSHAHGRDER